MKKSLILQNHNRELLLMKKVVLEEEMESVSEEQFIDLLQLLLSDERDKLDRLIIEMGLPNSVAKKISRYGLTQLLDLRLLLKRDRRDIFKIIDILRSSSDNSQIFKSIKLSNLLSEYGLDKMNNILYNLIFSRLKRHYNGLLEELERDSDISRVKFKVKSQYVKLIPIDLKCQFINHKVHSVKIVDSLVVVYSDNIKELFTINIKCLEISNE